MLRCFQAQLHDLRAEYQFEFPCRLLQKFYAVTKDSTLTYAIFEVEYFSLGRNFLGLN